MAFPQNLTNAVDGPVPTGTKIAAKLFNELEKKVGIDGSADAASLDYLLKNPASLDPGHGHAGYLPLLAGGNTQAVLLAAINALAGQPAVLHLAPGTWVLPAPQVVPANITLAPERGALLSVTIQPVAIQALSQANPCVVTWTGHGLVTGDRVKFWGIAQDGWKILNEFGAMPVTRIDEDHLSLDNMNTTTWSMDGTNEGKPFLVAYSPSTDPGVVSKVIVLNGNLVAGPHPVFQQNIPGQVVLGDYSSVEQVLPQWFGAVGDNVTDCSAAVQAAYMFQSRYGGTVNFPNGSYLMTAGVVLQREQPNSAISRVTYQTRFNGGRIYYTEPRGVCFKSAPPHRGFLNWMGGKFTFSDGVLQGIEAENYRQVLIDLSASIMSSIARVNFRYADVGLRMGYAFWDGMEYCDFYHSSLEGPYDGWVDRGSGTVPTNGIQCGGSLKFGTTHFSGVRSNWPHHMVSMTRANPCRVEWGALTAGGSSVLHYLADGDMVFIDGIGQAAWQGMNLQRVFVKVIDDHTVELYDDVDLTVPINTSAYSEDFLPADGTNTGAFVMRYLYAWRAAMWAHCQDFGFEQGGNVDMVQIIKGKSGDSMDGDMKGIFTEASPLASYISIKGAGHATLNIERFSFDVPGPSVWAANQSYGAGAKVQPVGGQRLYMYVASGAGTSAGTEPTWPTTVGGMVWDNNISWTCKLLRPFAIDAYDAKSHGMIRVRNMLPGWPGMLRSSITNAPAWFFDQVCSTDESSYDYAGDSKWWWNTFMPSCLSIRDYNGRKLTTTYPGSGTPVSSQGFRVDSQGNLSDANKSGGPGSFDRLYGASQMMQQMTAEVTCSGPTTNINNIIPNGVWVTGTTARVTAAITGTGVTGFDLGPYGGTQDLWGKDISKNLNTTSDGKTATHTAPWFSGSATQYVTLTFKGGTATGGKVRVTVHYLRLIPPSS